MGGLGGGGGTGRPNFCNVSNIFRHFCQEKHFQDFESSSSSNNSITEYEHMLATSLFEHFLIIIEDTTTTKTNATSSELSSANSSLQTALNPKNVQVKNRDATRSHSQIKTEPLEISGDSEMEVTNASAPETKLDASKMGKPVSNSDDGKWVEFFVGGDVTTSPIRVPNPNASVEKDVQKDEDANGCESDSDDYPKERDEINSYCRELAKIQKRKIEAHPTDKSLMNKYKNYISKQICKEVKRLENEDRARRGLPRKKINKKTRQLIPAHQYRC